MGARWPGGGTRVREAVGQMTASSGCEEHTSGCEDRGAQPSAPVFTVCVAASRCRRRRGGCAGQAAGGGCLREGEARLDTWIGCGYLATSPRPPGKQTSEAPNLPAPWANGLMGGARIGEAERRPATDKPGRRKRNEDSVVRGRAVDGRHAGPRQPAPALPRGQMIRLHGQPDAQRCQRPPLDPGAS